MIAPSIVRIGFMASFAGPGWNHNDVPEWLSIYVDNVSFSVFLQNMYSMDANCLDLTQSHYCILWRCPCHFWATLVGIHPVDWQTHSCEWQMPKTRLFILIVSFASVDVFQYSLRVVGLIELFVLTATSVLQRFTRKLFHSADFQTSVISIFHCAGIVLAVYQWQHLQR